MFLNCSYTYRRAKIGERVIGQQFLRSTCFSGQFNHFGPVFKLDAGLVITGQDKHTVVQSQKNPSNDTVPGIYCPHRPTLLLPRQWFIFLEPHASNGSPKRRRDAQSQQNIPPLGISHLQKVFFAAHQDRLVGLFIVFVPSRTPTFERKIIRS
jgi:hypothetical protein